MSETLDYTIENVGGVERADLHLRPGVNALSGANGAGKTSAIRAVTRASGGDVDVERRDGADHGEVHGPGVFLRVGAVTKRTGTAALSLADVSPLSTLIEPGFKDTDASARGRIKALIELLGLTVDDASVETLCQNDVGLLGWLRSTVRDEVIDDLMEAAEKLRHHTHALARTCESAADSEMGRASASRERADELLEKIGGKARLSEQSVDEARAALVAGSSKYARLEAQCEAREQLEAQQAEIQKTIGERPDLEDAQAQLDQAQSDAQAALAEVERLQAELAEAREVFATRTEAQRSASERLIEETERAKRWDEQQAVLAKPVEGPTREELVALRAEHVEGAEQALDRSQHSHDYREALAECIAADETSRAEGEKAKYYRNLAKAIPDQLGAILAAAGAKDLTVVDGRLCAVRDGRPLDFEKRLSDGQRVRAALDVAAQVYEGRVVPLSGAFWTRLDPENRAAFAKEAAARGLYVLTEEPTGGDLRVEHLS